MKYLIFLSLILVIFEIKVKIMRKPGFPNKLSECAASH